MSALEADFQYLKDTLTGDATLTSLLTGGWHQAYAPVSILPPYGVYGMQSPNNMLSMTATRIYSPNLLMVKAVGPAVNMADLHAANNRFQELLDDENIIVDAGIILACFEETPLYYTELINGEPWFHVGGLYRLQTK